MKAKLSSHFRMSVLEYWNNFKADVFIFRIPFSEFSLKLTVEVNYVDESSSNGQGQDAKARKTDP